MKLKINKLAVITCVIISLALTYAWYTIFSESWLISHGMIKEVFKEKYNSGPIAIAIIAQFITYYVMAWFFVKLNVKNAAKGLTTALLMAFAFCVVVIYTINAFTFKPKELSFIDGGIILITWMISGAILGRWKKYRNNEND